LIEKPRDRCESVYTFPGNALVDEIANLGEDGVAQFDAEETGADGRAEVSFESQQNGRGQICLLAKQAEQSCAVGGKFVVTRQSASRLEG